MNDILTALVLLLVALLVFSAVFVLGYKISTNRIKSMEDVEYNSKENPFRSGGVTYDWKLTAEEIDKIDDWEEFEEKAEE